MGLLGWTPSAFWRATMHDLSAAVEGWRVAQGDTLWRDRALAAELKDALDDFITKGR